MWRLVTLLATFLFNVVLVMLFFSIALLLILWMIGKRKAEQEARLAARATHYPQRPHMAATPYDHMEHDADGTAPAHRQYEHGQHNRNPHAQQQPPPANYQPSPAFSFAPRRLSFSAALTPLGAPGHTPFNTQPTAPQTTTTALPATTPIPPSSTPRRVTFSLTPEQQQNEYDKCLSANLRRHRPPTLTASPATPAHAETPLIELFPTATSASTSTHAAHIAAAGGTPAANPRRAAAHAVHTAAASALACNAQPVFPRRRDDVEHTTANVFQSAFFAPPAHSLQPPHVAARANPAHGMSYLNQQPAADGGANANARARVRAAGPRPRTPHMPFRSLRDTPVFSPFMSTRRLPSVIPSKRKTSPNAPNANNAPTVAKPPLPPPSTNHHHHHQHQHQQQHQQQPHMAKRFRKAHMSYGTGADIAVADTTAHDNTLHEANGRVLDAECRRRRPPPLPAFAFQ